MKTYIIGTESLSRYKSDTGETESLLSFLENNGNSFLIEETEVIKVLREREEKILSKEISILSNGIGGISMTAPSLVDGIPPLPPPTSSSELSPPPKVFQFSVTNKDIPVLPSPRQFKGKTIASSPLKGMTKKSPKIHYESTNGELNTFTLNGQRLKANYSPKKASTKKKKDEVVDESMEVINPKLPEGLEPEQKEIPILTTLELQENDPDEDLKNMNEFAKSTHWFEQNLAVDCFRRLTAFHQDKMIASLPLMLPIIRASVDNLRSAICKNAIYALIESFTKMGSNEIMHSDLDHLLPSLMAKACGDKKFISTLALNALEAIIDSNSNEKIVKGLMKFSNEKNARIQSMGSLLLERCIKNITSFSDIDNANSILMNCLVKEVFEGFYNYLESRLSSARSYAKNAMVLTSVRVSLTKFEASALDTLPEKNVQKLIREIKSTFNNENTKQISLDRKKAMERIREQKRKSVSESDDIIVIEPSTKKNFSKSFSISPRKERKIIIPISPKKKKIVMLKTLPEVNKANIDIEKIEEKDT